MTDERPPEIRKQATDPTFPLKSAKPALKECEQCTKLKEINADLLEACKAALRYLKHPDLQAIPFVQSAAFVADKIAATIAKAEGR